MTVNEERRSSGSDVDGCSKKSWWVEVSDGGGRLKHLNPAGRWFMTIWPHESPHIWPRHVSLRPDKPLWPPLPADGCSPYRWDHLWLPPINDLWPLNDPTSFPCQQTGHINPAAPSRTLHTAGTTETLLTKTIQDSTPNKKKQRYDFITDRKSGKFWLKSSHPSRNIHILHD